MRCRRRRCRRALCLNCPESRRPERVCIRSASPYSASTLDGKENAFIRPLPWASSLKKSEGGRPLKCAHSIVKNQDTSWAWKTQVGTSCSPTQVCGLAREGPAAMRSPPLQQSWPCVATQTAAWKQLSHLGKFAEASLWHRVDLCGLELIIDWEPERPPGLSPWKCHQHRSSRCRLLGDCR